MYACAKFDRAERMDAMWEGLDIYKYDHHGGGGGGPYI
jgi:hypothetical protein